MRAHTKFVRCRTRSLVRFVDSARVCVCAACVSERKSSLLNVRCSSSSSSSELLQQQQQHSSESARVKSRLSLCFFFTRSHYMIRLHFSLSLLLLLGRQKDHLKMGSLAALNDVVFFLSCLLLLVSPFELRARLHHMRTRRRRCRSSLARLHTQSKRRFALT